MFRRFFRLIGQLCCFIISPNWSGLFHALFLFSRAFYYDCETAGFSMLKKLFSLIMHLNCTLNDWFSTSLAMFDNWCKLKLLAWIVESLLLFRISQTISFYLDIKVKKKKTCRLLFLSWWLFNRRAKDMDVHATNTNERHGREQSSWCHLLFDEKKKQKLEKKKRKKEKGN